MKELGMDEFLTVLREEYLQPLVDVAFPHIGQCDSHRAFTVKYNADGTVQAGDGDKYLGLHYDNAEVTINVCLQADNCKGSDLMFLGIADVSLGYIIFTLHSFSADIKKKTTARINFGTVSQKMCTKKYRGLGHHDFFLQGVQLFFLHLTRNKNLASSNFMIHNLSLTSGTGLRVLVLSSWKYLLNWLFDDWKKWIERWKFLRWQIMGSNVNFVINVFLSWQTPANCGRAAFSRNIHNS